MAEQTYRLIARRLKVSRGKLPRLDLARPATEDGAFTDSDEAPTLVTFDAHCEVDVDYLLRSGAIVPWAPKGSGKRGEHGEERS